MLFDTCIPFLIFDASWFIAGTRLSVARAVAQGVELDSVPPKKDDMLLKIPGFDTCATAAGDFFIFVAPGNET